MQRFSLHGTARPAQSQLHLLHPFIFPMLLPQRLLHLSNRDILDQYTTYTYDICLDLSRVWWWHCNYCQAPANGWGVPPSPKPPLLRRISTEYYLCLCLTRPP
jgi:hypothetical protein